MDFAEKEMAKMAALFRPISRWESTHEIEQNETVIDHIWGRAKAKCQKQKGFNPLPFHNIAISQFILDALTLFS